MPISDEARKNHDEPFPGHALTLKVTEPELIDHRRSRHLNTFPVIH